MSPRISPLWGSICSEALVALMSPAWLGTFLGPPGGTLLVYSLLEVGDPQPELPPPPNPSVPALARCLLFSTPPHTLLSMVIGVCVVTTGM